MSTGLRLDDLYKMTAHIYSEQNAHRPASATFTHFVEVCGILTIHAREKKREEVTFEDALCKALGWFFPLMAKFKVSSIEELVYRKYPFACPYCREAPHRDAVCKTVKGTKKTVDHAALRQKYVENKRIRPKSLNEWQQMFDTIYRRSIDDLKRDRSVVGLFEELGELAEAVRVFERYPKYFAGEAADVFSYLMGLANEHALRMQRDDLGMFDFEAEFIKRYPGLCVQCGCSVCVCPLVPDATVGRMAKELDISSGDELFASDFEVLLEDSSPISEKVLSTVGGYSALANGFPFDRGDANKAVVLLCLKLADQVDNKDVAERLRSAAFKAGTSATYPGSPKQPERLEQIIAPLREIMEDSQSALNAVLRNPNISAPSIQGLVIEEYVAGDKYVSGQVAAQGPGAHADLRFVNAWKDLSSSINLSQLAKELAGLRAQLDTREDAPTVGQLTEAEEAAKRGNGANVLAALSKTGKWVLDVATKIGTDVAVAAIKASYGL